MNQRSNHQPCRKPVLDKSCPIVAQLNVRLNQCCWGAEQQAIEQEARACSKKTCDSDVPCCMNE